MTLTRRAGAPRRLVAARLGAIGAGSAALVLLVATPASAHHADVLAVADCSGLVTWSLQSWAGQPDTANAPHANTLSRTNDAVRLSWSVDGKKFTDVSGGTALGAADNYSATGAFHLPAGPVPPRLVVRATAGHWANGNVGGSRSTPLLDLSRCRPDPAAAVKTPSVLAGGGGSAGAGGRSGDRLPVTLSGGAAGALGVWWLVRPKRRRDR